jgi:maltose alpha-D-glucosyltransferase/alpha-amylase
MKTLPVIPENCQWAIFLRNHDELSLEMVTDKERDYMYEAYAEDKQMRLNLGIRRRLAPLLDNNRKIIELAYTLLLTLPGTPVIYYGDELGMGDNIYLGDRNGVRTPMHWNFNKNAGFSDCNPSRLYAPVILDPEYNFNTINVESQTHSKSSLYQFVSRMIRIRKKYEVFGSGSLNFLYPENKKILIYLREYENTLILAALNLSGSAEAAEIDLKSYSGKTPVEITSDSRFPQIGELNYLLTFPPYGFYLFELSEN